MNRRRFLAVVGGVVALAGCTTSDDDPSSAESPSTPTELPSTPTETRTATPTGPSEYELGETAEFGGLELSVISAAVRDLAIAPYPAFAVGENPDGFQFLVLGVGTDEIGSDEFTPTYELWLDGEPVDYAERAPSFSGSPPLDSSDDATVPVAHGPDIDGGEPIAIPVPTGEYERVGVHASDGDRQSEPEAVWELPEGVVADLALEPAYEVRDAGVRIDQEADEYMLDLTVENAGDRDGVYQGVMALEGAPDLDRVFTVAVPEGETVTEEVPFEFVSPSHAVDDDLPEYDEDELPDVEVSRPGSRRFELSAPVE